MERKLSEMEEELKVSSLNTIIHNIHNTTQFVYTDISETIDSVTVND